ncbi:MAG: hypothetical protein K8T20_12240 [Planctomycetes bacterium]|nr:hypothetical protein [Planctomycetota bacterium]
MAETHAERGEGLIARYKAALCSIDLGEKDEGMAELRVLQGSSHEALQTPGIARIALKSKNFKEAWAALTAGCERYRNDPLRVEIWTNVLSAVDRVERESTANARMLYLGLLKLSFLHPHEVTQVCGALMRLAVAAGGPALARTEAFGLFDAHPTQFGIRMELHSFLNRLGAPHDALPAVRQALQKTLDLSDQVTRRDRARLLLWLIETHLAEGDVAGAEKWLTNAVSSLSHPSSAGLWARNWRALVAGAQGKWPEAEKFLGLHAATYATGESGMHFLSALLESLAAGAGVNSGPIQATLARKAEGKPAWASLAAALAGTEPLETFMGWTTGQSRDTRCPLLLAASVVLAARGDAAGAETLLARAARESDGRAFATWFAESRRGLARSGNTGTYPPVGPKTAKFK